MKTLTENNPALEAAKMSLNNLREQIQQAARKDERFNQPLKEGEEKTCGGPCSVWIEDVLEESGQIEAIINAANGKTYAVEVMMTEGAATLGESHEVVRQTEYRAVQTPAPVAEAAAEEPDADTAPLEASVAIAAPEQATGEFMFMPSGVHELSLTKGGAHLDVVVNVTRPAAAALQKQLEAVNARSAHPAFFDFNHEHKAASFWPKRFVWRETPAAGVYVQGEWSTAGKEALEGKVYRAFSPAFHTDAAVEVKKRGGAVQLSIAPGARGSEENPAAIECNAHAARWFGGLVNDPAFESIAPLTAKKSESPVAGAAGHNQQKNTGAPALPVIMKTPEQIAAEKAALEARNAQLETRITELEAKDDAVAKAQLEAARAERDALEAKLQLIAKDEKLAALEAADTQRKADAADAAVEAMKANGTIPMLDKETAADYRKKFIADPSLIPLLTKAKGNPALEAGRRTKGGAAHDITYGQEGPTNILKALTVLTQRQLSIRGMDAGAVKERQKIALEAASIYNREILDTVLEAEGARRIRPDFIGAPLEAATDADVLGTLSGTLVAQRALQLFKYKLPLVDRILIDFSEQQAVKGQVVATRKITVPSVQTYDPTLGVSGRPNGWATASAATTVDATVALDELVGVPIPLSMSTLSSTHRNLFAETAPAATYALAKYFIDKIYAKATAANFNAYAAVGAKVPTAYATYAAALVDFARSKVAEIGAAFDWNEVPEEDRTLILNPSYYAKGTTDPSLVNFFAGQQSPGIVTQGVLPPLNDFGLLKAGNFPQTNNRVGIAIQRNAFIGVSRLPSDYTQVLPGANNGAVSQITDPETGMTVMLIQYVNHQQGYAEWLICALLGADVGDKRAGLVLTSQ